jgi:hypothetical protein
MRRSEDAPTADLLVWTWQDESARASASLLEELLFFGDEFVIANVRAPSLFSPPGSIHATRQGKNEKASTWG